MRDKRGEWVRAEELGLESSILVATVVFRQSLIAFYKEVPMRAVKFDNLSRPDYVRTTELPPFTHRTCLYEKFATCIIKDRYVLVTGG